MYQPRPPRVLSAATSVGIVALMGAVLMLGLGVPRAVQQAAMPLMSVAFTEVPKPPPPPRPRPVEREHVKKSRAKDKPSPRNIRNQATQIVAPPVVQPIVPPPVVAAPIAGVGSAANNGASNLAGPGQGAGGNGNGLGGGGNGGEGDDDDSVVGPRQVGGRMSYRDLPEGTLADGQEAAVEVLYTVNPDGRVSNCRITRSSRIPLVDATACRLIEERFRFRPALDENGRPVRSEVIETHTWIGRER